MVAGMGDNRGQRALRIIPVASGDAGRLAHPRAAPIGPDDEARPQRKALARQQDAVLVGRDPGDEARLVADPGRGGEPGRQRRDQLGILDIPAEGGQPDLGGAELDRGLAEQAAGVVDEPHHGQRRGLVGQRVMQAELAEQPPGAVEQGDGAAVAMGRTGPSRAMRRPPSASASAAASPTAPAPTMAMSTWSLRGVVMPLWLRQTGGIGHGAGRRRIAGT